MLMKHTEERVTSFQPLSVTEKNLQPLLEVHRSSLVATTSSLWLLETPLHAWAVSDGNRDTAHVHFRFHGYCLLNIAKRTVEPQSL